MRCSVLRSGIAFWLLIAAVCFQCSSSSAQLFRPPGLLEGDEYRLAFVTSVGRDALSTEINDYNAFVQSVADASLLGRDNVTWRAIASTADVHAWDNTLTNRNLLGNGVPVYHPDGSRIASGNQDIWDTYGYPKQNRKFPIGFTESGDPYEGYVYTGIFDGSFFPGPLGTPNPTIGLSSGRFWATDGPADYFGIGPDETLPFYALSSVITATAPRIVTYESDYSGYAPTPDARAYLTLEWLSDSQAVVQKLSFPDGVFYSGQEVYFGDYPVEFDEDPRTGGPPVLSLRETADGRLVAEDLAIVSSPLDNVPGLFWGDLGACATYSYSTGRYFTVDFVVAGLSGFYDPSGIGTHCINDNEILGITFSGWQRVKTIPEPSGLLLLLLLGMLGLSLRATRLAPNA